MVGICSHFDEDDSSIFVFYLSADDNEDYCDETIPFDDDDNACKE